MSDDIDIRRAGRTGRITLTRPDALNAMTYDMAIAIEDALDAWTADGETDLIAVDAEGDRAFCAGGDVADLYARARSGDLAYARKFWADEYRLNAKIAASTLPYVAIMDGITMGGGVGISAHGSYRVVTSRTVLAMPECAIGLVPDVGGNWILSRAPGHLGEFLAMTGWRLNGADAILSGFADIAVDDADLGELLAALEAEADPAVLDRFRRPAGTPPLDAHREAIDRHFSHASALECLQSLESDGSDFAVKAASMIRRGCPISVASAFEIVRRARDLGSLEEVLALEYRFTWRSVSNGDFLEGIRAQIIEKDRNPRWRTPRLEEVFAADVDAMLAPLGPDELNISQEAGP